VGTPTGQAQAGAIPKGRAAGASLEPQPPSGLSFLGNEREDAEPQGFHVFAQAVDLDATGAMDFCTTSAQLTLEMADSPNMGSIVPLPGSSCR
jgi:hypothetical protein